MGRLSSVLLRTSRLLLACNGIRSERSPLEASCIVRQAALAAAITRVYTKAGFDIWEC